MQSVCSIVERVQVVRRVYVVCLNTPTTLRDDRKENTLYLFIVPTGTKEKTRKTGLPTTKGKDIGGT